MLGIFIPLNTRFLAGFWLTALLIGVVAVTLFLVSTIAIEWVQGRARSRKHKTPHSELPKAA